MSSYLGFTELKANPKEVREGSWTSGLSREELAEAMRKDLLPKKPVEGHRVLGWKQ